MGKNNYQHYPISYDILLKYSSIHNKFNVIILFILAAIFHIITNHIESIYFFYR